MANRFVSPEQQFINFAGQPYANGQLFFYISETNVPTPTYQDEALSTPNSNPVILDSAGNAGNIFLNPAIVYKVILEDEYNNQIWAFDPVIPTDAPSNAAVSGIISCTANGTNAITLTAINATQQPSAYANYLVFAFVPSETPTGAITIQSGSLAFFPLFLASGVQANANDLIAGQGPYFVAYGSIIAGATPGFLLLNQNANAGTLPISSATTISDIHNHKILQLGGGSFYAVEFPSGTDLAEDFECILVNEETTPIGKGIGGTDQGSFTQYPGQSYRVFNDGGTVRVLGGRLPYIVNSVAIFMDTGLGSDDPLVSDGLSTGARAYKTANAMWSAFKANFDHNGSGGASMNTMAGTIQESITFGGQPKNCPDWFINGPSPLGTTWQPPSSGATPYCWIRGDGVVFEHSNILIDASNVSGNAVGIQCHQISVSDQNSGCGFGNFGAGGSQVTTDGIGAQYNVNASYAISGDAANHIQVPSAAYASVSGSITITITGTPAFSDFYRAVGSGANISLGSGITYSGSITAGCTKWFSGTGAVISLQGNAANVPGSVAGNPATGSTPTGSTGWANA
jgi:hypothetical protein